MNACAPNINRNANTPKTGCASAYWAAPMGVTIMETGVQPGQRTSVETPQWLSSLAGHTADVKQAEPLLKAVSEYLVRGWERPADHPSASVLFDDGICRPVDVLGWVRDPDRGWVMDLRWPSGHREWRVYDSRYVHSI